MKQIACIGECMVELVPEPDSDKYALGFAGDTFNTAVYCKRCLSDSADIYYLTALGDDPLSRKMIKCFESEGIRADLVRILPEKRPGLYLIENDEKGERFFQYWRSDSAARMMFSEITSDQLQDTLSPFDLIYLSGISLAILDLSQREVLFSALKNLKSDRIIAFDTNLRPALWSDLDIARQTFRAMGEVATIVLSGLDDENILWPGSSKEDILKCWQQWGCREVILKNGSAGCYIAEGNNLIHIPSVENLKPIDTTGAGDSFCAGYLSARLNDLSTREAAGIGNKIAAQVIQFRGGIVPSKHWQPYS